MFLSKFLIDSLRISSYTPNPLIFQSLHIYPSPLWHLPTNKSLQRNNKNRIKKKGKSNKTINFKTNKQKQKQKQTNNRKKLKRCCTWLLTLLSHFCIVLFTTAKEITKMFTRETVVAEHSGMSSAFLTEALTVSMDQIELHRLFLIKQCHYCCYKSYNLYPLRAFCLSSSQSSFQNVKIQ